MKASGYMRAEADWYTEPRWAVDLLLDREEFPTGVWDPCCGSGTIPKACLDRKIPALGSDIADRPYGAPGMDFFGFTETTARSIVSNPPYDVLQEFIDHALRLTTAKVAVIARIAFLCGQKRKPWYEAGPLARVYAMSRRPSMPPGGTDVPAFGGSVDYAWFVFDRAASGAPTIGWLA